MLFGYLRFPLGIKACPPWYLCGETIATTTPHDTLYEYAAAEQIGIHLARLRHALVGDVDAMHDRTLAPSEQTLQRLSAPAAHVEYRPASKPVRLTFDGVDCETAAGCRKQMRKRMMRLDYGLSQGSKRIRDCGEKDVFSFFYFFALKKLKTKLYCL